MKRKIYEIELQIYRKGQNKGKIHRYIGDKKQIMDFVKIFKYKNLRKCTKMLIDKNHIFAACEGNGFYSHATVCIKGVYHRRLDENHVSYNQMGKNTKHLLNPLDNEIKNKILKTVKTDNFRRKFLVFERDRLSQELADPSTTYCSSDGHEAHIQYDTIEFKKETKNLVISIETQNSIVKKVDIEIKGIATYYVTNLDFEHFVGFSCNINVFKDISDREFVLNALDKFVDIYS